MYQDGIIKYVCLYVSMYVCYLCFEQCLQSPSMRASGRYDTADSSPINHIHTYIQKYVVGSRSAGQTSLQHIHNFPK